ncbi:SET domain-containing protein [Atractiella rhizophila]|nr:SET domain-containing protein [Atractiella rhizophila]
MVVKSTSRSMGTIESYSESSKMGAAGNRGVEGEQGNGSKLSRGSGSKEQVMGDAPQNRFIDPEKILEEYEAELREKRIRTFREIGTTTPTWLLRFPPHETDPYNDDPSLDAQREITPVGKMLSDSKQVTYYPQRYKSVIYASESFKGETVPFDREPLFSPVPSQQERKKKEWMKSRVARLKVRVQDITRYKLLYRVLLDILRHFDLDEKDLRTILENELRQSTSTLAKSKSKGKAKLKGPQQTELQPQRTTILEILKACDGILPEWHHRLRHEGDVFGKWEEMLRCSLPTTKSRIQSHSVMKLRLPGKYTINLSNNVFDQEDSAFGWCSRCFMFNCNRGHQPAKWKDGQMAEQHMSDRKRVLLFKQSVPFKSTEEIGQVIEKYQIKIPRYWNGRYEPCCHPGDCLGPECTCDDVHSFCDKWCQCDPSCPRRFRGCDCTSRGANCRFEDSCQCRQNKRECDMDLCQRCDEINGPSECSNVSIQEQRSKSTKIVASKYGFGLALLQKAKRGDFIGDYAGEVVNPSEEGRRFRYYNALGSSYLFDAHEQSPNKKASVTEERRGPKRPDHIIDSFRFGTKTRFVNDPHGITGAKSNVQPDTVVVRGELHIPFYAETNIEAGSELFFGYGNNYWDGLKK